MLITLFDLIVVVMGFGPMVGKFAGWRRYRRGWAHGWADGRDRKLARSGIIHADSCGGKLFVWFMARMARSLHVSGTA